MVHTYHKLQLDCLFMLGGNGSTKTANRLREEGLNVIALPKTIDNDTWGTEMTFLALGAPSTSPPSASTTFTPPLRATVACSSSRSWDTRSAGFRYMPASRAARMSS